MSEQLFTDQLTETCPYCEQPISRAKLNSIHARIRQEEGKRVREMEALARKQLESKHQRDLQVQQQLLTAKYDERISKINTDLVREREEAQKKEAETLARLTAELAKTREEERQTQIKLKDAEVVKLTSDFNRERERLIREVTDLKRQVEKRTAHELGDGPELDLVDLLREAFPDDVVQRVPKGEMGADVIHEVRYRGESCGQIVYDSKNRRAWRYDYVTKLREDQARAGAAHAVLTTTCFPSGEEGISIQDGVFVLHPRYARQIANVLRSTMISIHRQGLSAKERTSKMAQVYAYLVSGEFRQRIKEAEDLVDEVRVIDNQERDAHEKVWKTRQRAMTKMKSTIAEIDTRVTEILEKPGEQTPTVQRVGDVIPA